MDESNEIVSSANFKVTWTVDYHDERESRLKLQFGDPTAISTYREPDRARFLFLNTRKFMKAANTDTPFYRQL